MRAILMLGLCACAGGLTVAQVERCGPPQGPASPPALTPDAHRTAFFSAHPLPQLQNQGGATLTKPRIIAAFEAGDPLQSETEAMLQSYGCTSYWRDAVSEYGTGDAAFDHSVLMKAPADATDETSVAQWVVDQVGAPPKDTLLMAFLSRNDLPDACTTLLGYHQSVNGTPVAVILNCAPSGWLTQMDQRAHALSHELIETALDVNLMSPAWRGLDQPGWAEAPGEDESADFCEGRTVDVMDYPFSVSPAWSNLRAQAGFDPCSSTQNTIAIASPSQPTIDLSSTGDARFDLTLFSDDPTATFTVFVSPQINNDRCVGASTDPVTAVGLSDGAVVHVYVTELQGMCAPQTSGDSGLAVELYPSNATTAPLPAFVPITGF